jgi:hypothetical protein
LRQKLFSDQAVKPDGVALTSIEHPHLGKPSKHKISKKSLETMVLETEWVGLTAQDLADVGVENVIGAVWADAKLKEKNGG